MTSLIITLPPTLPAIATPCDAVLSHDGLTLASHTQGPLALLPTLSGAETVAVVPARQLSWHRLELPRGTLERGFLLESNAPRLRSVLDGLLEDRLLDDPAQLHFAIAPQAKAGEPVWVAAVDRAWLHAWLAALEQAGRPPTRIVPEFAPADASTDGASTLTVIGTTHTPQLVQTTPAGVNLLPLDGQTAALVAWPDSAEVLAEPAVAALAEQLFKSRVNLQTPQQRALAAAQSPWELAQFDLLHTRRARTRKRLSALGSTLLHAPRWRAARWAAVALVVVNLAGLQAWAWKEQSALAAQKAAIRSTLTSTFPDVQVVVDARLQMARALADLQRQSGTASNADLETMLGRYMAIAPVKSSPSAIEYAAGELKLSGLELAAGSESELLARLKSQGYAAQWDGTRLILKPERQP